MTIKEQVKRYCIEVLGMTHQQARERMLKEWEKKLRENAREYHKASQEQGK